MSMALNSNLSSRQKMINMMYIVLTAMLALNVSSDVLVGFEMMEEEMNKEVRISLEYNKELMNKFSLYYNGNPERMSSWYEKAHKIHSMSDSLYSFIQDLKAQIIREA
ncbi:MAG TPA: gliding motility protein GldM, partial [Porphyromonadaceae bacterium]|nr:gliding motility protein GldM [Porphyromonadaceae bacterium]